MTSAQDPPRLRTFGDALPKELLDALATSPNEEASTTELAALDLSVRTAIAGEQTVSTSRQARAPNPRGRQRAVFGGSFGLATTFALGASAGVLVVTAVHFAPHLHANTEVRASTSAVAAPTMAPRTANTPPRARHPASDAPPVEPALEPSHAVSASPSVHASAAPSASNSAGTAIEELSLLAQAQAALEADPRRALVLTNDHERRFAGGALAQEREVIAIDALVRLGRRAEATARAARFHRRYPTSVHGRRVDVLLGAAAP